MGDIHMPLTIRAWKPWIIAVHGSWSNKISRGSIFINTWLMIKHLETMYKEDYSTAGICYDDAIDNVIDYIKELRYQREKD